MFLIGIFLIFISSRSITLLYRKWRIVLYERFLDILFLLGMDVDRRPARVKSLFLSLHTLIIIGILCTAFLNLFIPLIIFMGVIAGRFPDVRVITVEEMIERQITRVGRD